MPRFQVYLNSRFKETNAPSEIIYNVELAGNADTFFVEKAEVYHKDDDEWIDYTETFNRLHRDHQSLSDIFHERLDDHSQKWEATDY